MKKIIIKISALISAAALLPAFAYAQMTSNITIPSSTVPNIESYASSMFSNFSTVIELIAGVILAGILIEIIIGSMRK